MCLDPNSPSRSHSSIIRVLPGIKQYGHSYGQTRKIPIWRIFKEIVSFKDPGVEPKGVIPQGTKSMIHCLQVCMSWEKATDPPWEARKL